MPSKIFGIISNQTCIMLNTAGISLLTALRMFIDIIAPNYQLFLKNNGKSQTTD